MKKKFWACAMTISLALRQIPFSMATANVDLMHEWFPTPARRNSKCEIRERNLTKRHRRRENIKGRRHKAQTRAKLTARVHLLLKRLLLEDVDELPKKSNRTLRIR